MTNYKCFTWLLTERCFICLLPVLLIHTSIANGPLARYVKLRVAHAPGISGTFSLPPRVSDPDMRRGTCLPHVPWWMSGSLTSGFVWSRWRGRLSQHSRCMRNLQFHVSGKSLIACPISATNKGVTNRQSSRIRVFLQPPSEMGLQIERISGNTITMLCHAARY